MRQFLRDAFSRQNIAAAISQYAITGALGLLGFVALSGVPDATARSWGIALLVPAVLVGGAILAHAYATRAQDGKAGVASGPALVELERQRIERERQADRAAWDEVTQMSAGIQMSIINPQPGSEVASEIGIKEALARWDRKAADALSRSPMQPSGGGSRTTRSCCARIGGRTAQSSSCESRRSGLVT